MENLNEFQLKLEAALSTIDRSGHPSEYYTDQELEVLLKINPMLIPAIRTKEKKQEIKEYEEKKKEEETQKQIRDEYIDLIKDKKWGDASELLVNYIKSKLNLFTTKIDLKSEIWVYKNGIYTPQGRSEIKELLRITLKKWFTSWMLNQVMNKIEPDTYIEPEMFFKNAHRTQIPVQNGILDVVTRKLEEFTPKKIFFNKLPVIYDPKKKCPKIESFLEETLSNFEDKKVFYEIVGFCLLKEYKYEKAFMFIGDGRNGKDKSLELIKRLVGIDNCCSIPLHALIPDSFIISELFGKMVNLAGEVGNQDLRDTTTLKSCTGRSLLSAQRKFLNAITFVNYAKFIFACNELPMIYDNSRGFWDRWVLLEFPYTFVRKEEVNKDSNCKLRDENIIDKISTPDELSGLLNNALDGLLRLIEQKDFSTTIGCQEIKEVWIRKANSVMAFCLDSVEEDYSEHISKKDFRRKYSEYCKKHKIKNKSDYVIKRTLEEMYGTTEENKEFLGVWEKAWGGIKWKEKREKTIKERDENTKISTGNGGVKISEKEAIIQKIQDEALEGTGYRISRK